MDSASSFRRGKGRGTGSHDVNGRGRPHSKNKTWVANSLRSGTNTPNFAENDRWERGGHRGGRGKRAGRPQTSPYLNAPPVASYTPAFDNAVGGREEEYTEEEYEEEMEEDELHEEIEEPVLDTPNARDKFYQELVKAREVERKQAIADGKMDDPLVPKRLEDAITMVGTCMDMAPRFERYRRERENNLFEWETIPGTKRVDHKRAVKMYERAAGDKTLPSDLRPPLVLKKTLDYLFHDLLPRGGFSQTFNFIRDRSRAVRNDFTMQHETGPLAIECHDRCARFHILALHLERERTGFSITLEEQQLMNTLQSLKEFYEDQRGRYESPNELEMRVYHRLIHIRDQRERHEDVPAHIVENPVFKLTTRFRQHVQAKSAPISKTSKLVVDALGMEIFGELAIVLREQGSIVMIYLVACILERLFGPDTIDDIESIRGGLLIPDIIDGLSAEPDLYDPADDGDEFEPDWITERDLLRPKPAPTESFGEPLSTSSQPFVTATASPQPAQSAFSNLSSTPNAFSTTSVFGVSAVSKSDAPKSVFGASTPNPFASTSPFGSNTLSNAFSSSSGGQWTFGSNPASSAFAPKAASPIPPVEAADSSAMLEATSTPEQTSMTTSFTPPAALSTRPVDTFGFNSRKEIPAQTLSAAGHRPHLPRPTLSFADSPLNPAAPMFFPAHKLPPSPLRFDGVEAPFQAQNSMSSSSTRPIPASSTLSQNTSIFNISNAPTPSFPTSTPEAIVEEVAYQAEKDTYTSLAFPTPPIFSTTPPSRPRINTTSSDPNIVADLPRSPLPQPPPLNKHHIISLPPTPTATSMTTLFPSPNAPKPPKSILHSLKGSLQIGVSVPNEVLSPLVLSSPSTSKTVQNLTNGISSSASPSRASFDRLSHPSNGQTSTNGKTKDSDLTLQARAIEFSRTSILVKGSFGRWRKQLADKIEWTEACRRSDDYSQKIQHQRVSHVLTSDRKRRATLSTLSDSPLRKRAKKRVSGEYKKPHTDEELAQRFKANHEEHERRWAQGSFLLGIRNYIKRQSSAHISGWEIWLSMNPESDGTAIWLERKFNIPASGHWSSETIFSIPLGNGGDSPVSPGLIVFERTPVEGITDEIERKYRVLDDCSRLRDIVEALPPRRHFVPSLLTISWVDVEHDDVAVDFNSMVSKLVNDGILGSHRQFSITTETIDLDTKLEDALRTLAFDVEGKLAQLLSVRGIFKSFESTWVDFSSEWLASCSASGEFDWFLYGKVVEASVSLLNSMATLCQGLLGINQSEPLPTFCPSGISDSNTAYDSAMSWLQRAQIRETANIVSRDLVSQRSMERDFPFKTFVDQLHELVICLVEHRVQGRAEHYTFVLKAELTSAVHQVEATASSGADNLRKAFSLHARRSPKRRSFDFEDSESSRFSTPYKRRKISVSNASTPSDGASQTSSPPSVHDFSPSPTASAATTAMDGEAPTITVAMLRALTKDVKAKFGGSLVAKG